MDESNAHAAHVASLGSIDEADATVQTALDASFNPLHTLHSGPKRDLKGGSLQAHISVVASHQDVAAVLSCLGQSVDNVDVTNWSYAYRITERGAENFLHEITEDGIDEGCGFVTLSVLRRFALQGLLVVISRWQILGTTSGLELYGTELHSIVSERTKNIIAHVKQAVGSIQPGKPKEDRFAKSPSRQSKVKTFSFRQLPVVTEPKPPAKYGPNHFLSYSPMSKHSSSISLPGLFDQGGDVQMWMDSGRYLQGMTDSDICALRAMRQPDWRVEEVLQAVAALRGKPIKPSKTPSARWGQCKDVLKSRTLRTELLLFDASKVPYDLAQHALTLLEGICVEDVVRASPCAAALFEWAVGIVRWRLVGPPAENTRSTAKRSRSGPSPKFPPLLSKSASLPAPSRPCCAGFRVTIPTKFKKWQPLGRGDLQVNFSKTK